MTSDKLLESNYYRDPEMLQREDIFAAKSDSHEQITLPGCLANNKSSASSQTVQPLVTAFCTHITEHEEPHMNSACTNTILQSETKTYDEPRITTQVIESRIVSEEYLCDIPKDFETYQTEVCDAESLSHARKQRAKYSPTRLSVIKDSVSVTLKQRDNPQAEKHVDSVTDEFDDEDPEVYSIVKKDLSSTNYETGLSMIQSISKPELPVHLQTITLFIPRAVVLPKKLVSEHRKYSRVRKTDEKLKYIVKKKNNSSKNISS